MKRRSSAYRARPPFHVRSSTELSAASVSAIGEWYSNFFLFQPFSHSHAVLHSSGKSAGLGTNLAEKYSHFTEMYRILNLALLCNGRVARWYIFRRHVYGPAFNVNFQCSQPRPFIRRGT